MRPCCGTEYAWRSTSSSASAIFVAVLVGLCAFYMGYRQLYLSTGWTRPFKVDEYAMPRSRTSSAGSGSRPRPSSRRSRSVLVDEGAVHGARGRRRLRDRRDRRHRDRRRVPLLEPAAARLPALRRRLADGSDPRDRADGRDLARRPGPPGLDAGRGDQRLPHVLPRRDQHPARPRLDRSAQARADALLRRLASGARCGGSSSRARCRTLLGVQGRCDGERRRRDHRRAAVVDPGRARRRDPQLRPVLLARSVGALGDEHHRRRCSGSSSSASSRSSERLVVRRAPENVA